MLPGTPEHRTSVLCLMENIPGSHTLVSGVSCPAFGHKSSVNESTKGVK